MMIVLTYDIDTTTLAGKKRLHGVAKLCESYGSRVQDSVFEILIDPTRLDGLKQSLSDMIDMERDTVRFYRLGKHYESRIDIMGRQDPLRPGGTLTV